MYYIIYYINNYIIIWIINFNFNLDNKFVDDSKLGKSLSSNEDVECLRRDLTNLEKWSNDWQMDLNTDKCAVMHLGRTNPSSQHVLNDKHLKELEKERDLGIIVDRNLIISEHCNKVVNTANVTLVIIKRTLNCKSKSVITTLFKALVRPQLEYCV